MENRNIEFFLEPFLDLETARRGDVFKVYAAERSSDRFYGVHNLIRVFRIQTNGKGIYPTEFLKEHCLAFHHRHRRSRSNVAETEYSSAVSHHRDRIFLDRKVEGFFGIEMNRFANARHAGRVSH